MIAEQCIVEAELTDTQRRIEHTSGKIVHEQERVRRYRRVVNRVEVFLSSWLENHLYGIRAIPLNRMKRVQGRGWFANNYGHLVIQQLHEMKEDAYQCRYNTIPLLELYNTERVVFKYGEGLKKKLLLRNDTHIREIPKIVHMGKVARDLELPLGIERTKESKCLGIYLMDEEDRDFEEKHTKLFASATFDLGDNKTLHTERFHLDFLMSVPEYGHQCAEAFLECIIEPLAIQHERQFSENAPILYSLLQDIDNESQARQILNNRLIIPTLLK
jgi:hypothetical protein